LIALALGLALPVCAYFAIDGETGQDSVMDDILYGRIKIMDRDQASCPVYDALTPGKYVPEYPKEQPDCSLYVGFLWVGAAAIVLSLWGAEAFVPDPEMEDLDDAADRPGLKTGRRKAIR
jgi:hypothetical protein